MTAQVFVVFEIWRFCDFFKKFKKTLIFFRKSWNSQPCSWVLSAYSKVLQILPPNMTVQILLVFEIWRFFVLFQKNCRKVIVFFRKSWNSQPCSWVLPEYSQGFRISPPNMTAQFFVVFEINFFFKVWNSQPCGWVLSGYSKVLQILPLNLTAQFFVVFEIWLFSVIFSKFF